MSNGKKLKYIYEIYDDTVAKRKIIGINQLFKEVVFEEALPPNCQVKFLFILEVGNNKFGSAGVIEDKTTREFRGIYPSTCYFLNKKDAKKELKKRNKKDLIDDDFYGPANIGE